MVFALFARQHLLDVVEASHEVRPERESLGPKLHRTPLWLAETVEPGPKHVVDDVLERDPALAAFLFESHRHIVVNGQFRML